MIDQPKTKSAEAEENLKKSEFNFMIHLKTLIHKTSVDPKLLQLKICVCNKQRDRAGKKISPVYSKITQQFGWLFAGDKIVIPGELKRPVVDALHFGHPGSTKMVVESIIFWWSGMKKNIANKCSTCTACMSSGKNSKYQLPLTENFRLPALTEPGPEIQTDFSGKLHSKLVTGEPYIFIGIDEYSKWPVVRICNSTKTREVIKFLESFVNFYSVPERIRSDKGSQKNISFFCNNRKIQIKYSPPRQHFGTGRLIAQHKR